MSAVAVIIVTWNSSKLIGRVLEALAHQTRFADRILVVDNGSADASECCSVVRKFEQAEWIPLKENLGFAAANNLAINLCQAMDYIALLNPDAFPASDWLAELVTAAERHPEAAAFASRLVCDADISLLDGAGDSLSISGKPRRRGYRLPAEHRYLQKGPVFSSSAAAALYRRQVFLAAGGFDENYFCYLEDVDLGFRMRLLGHEAFYVPTAIARHVGSATTGGQQGDFAVYHGHRNLVWTYVKDMPSILFWVFLPLHLAFNFISLLHFALRGQGGVIFKAKIDALKGLVRVWKERREIELTRKVSIWNIWRALDKRIWILKL